MRITFVTAFLDLDRESWESFSRSVNDYFNHFTPYVEFIKKSPEDDMIVFLDKKHIDKMLPILKGSERITIIPIDRNYMISNIQTWSRLEREREIMASDTYKKSNGYRTHPETINPEYTLINHAKIDFLLQASKISTSPYLAWTDFGYFASKDRIPSSPLDLNKIEGDKITYTLINPISDIDSDIYYTLKFYPETIGGFFFIGKREKIFEYSLLYNEVLDFFSLKEIADDDQHVALQCYIRRPMLFSLILTGKWHAALTYLSS